MNITQSHITTQLLRVLDSFELFVKANKERQGAISSISIQSSIQSSYASHSAQLHALTLLVLSVGDLESYDIAEHIKNVQARLDENYVKAIALFPLNNSPVTN